MGIQRSPKSVKPLEKNIEFDSVPPNFMSNVTPSNPKEVSDLTSSMFENYLSNVTSMYFSLGDSISKTSLNDVSLKLNSRTNEMPSSLNAESEQNLSENPGLLSDSFRFSTLDML